MVSQVKTTREKRDASAHLFLSHLFPSFHQLPSLCLVEGEMGDPDQDGTEDEEEETKQENRTKRKEEMQTTERTTLDDDESWDEEKRGRQMTMRGERKEREKVDD